MAAPAIKYRISSKQYSQDQVQLAQTALKELLKKRKSDIGSFEAILDESGALKVKCLLCPEKSPTVLSCANAVASMDSHLKSCPGLKEPMLHFPAKKLL